MTAIVSVYGQISTIRAQNGTTQATLKNEEGLFELQSQHCPHLVELEVGQYVHVAGQLRTYGKPGQTSSFIEPVYIGTERPDPTQHFKTILAVSLAGRACVSCLWQAECVIQNGGNQS